jgi:dTDP-4-amino-4,6-dideoxygalactose transaminase
MHNQTAFKDLDNSDIDYPVSTNLCKTVLSLPMHPYLTDKEIDLVCSSIIDYLKG